jgi:hypothetical protein
MRTAAPQQEPVAVAVPCETTQKYQVKGCYEQTTAPLGTSTGRATEVNKVLDGAYRLVGRRKRSTFTPPPKQASKVRS